MAMNTYDSGLFSEWLARWYLRLHGFCIVESRYVTGKNSGRAEIDIIARRGNMLIFVEVKKRASIDDAFRAISHDQTNRLHRAADTYMARIKWRGDARFDVIIVCNGRITWAKSAI